MHERTDTHPSPGPAVEKTRLAPSPTGSLHLGNAFAFLIAWAAARQHGWRVLLRLDDLDGPRIQAGAAAGVLDTLAWLGLDWDEGPVAQSDAAAPYAAAMQRLAADGLVYPCALSRKAIAAAATAPHAQAKPSLRGESRFPASLRPASLPPAFDDPQTNWRFATPPGAVTFEDACAGPQQIAPEHTIGDFVVWTKRGAPSYQLATVVDDAQHGVTRVIRGNDLLDSTARQLLLYRALRLQPEPAYAHLPLVVGPDGRRLAKRHGDTRVSHLRSLGATPGRVVGLLAHWAGAIDAPAPLSAEAFVGLYTAGTMPAGSIACTQEATAWLTAST